MKEDLAVAMRHAGTALESMTRVYELLIMDQDREPIEIALRNASGHVVAALRILDALKQ